jgi:hypothetical protein
MAFLSSQALKLTGGCFCNAIRYTIHVPDLSSRPLIPGALPTPTGRDKDGKTTQVETRFPLVGLDHCESCRRSCGGLVQCWCIVPVAWVQFRLRKVDVDAAKGGTDDGASSNAELDNLPTLEIVGKAALTSSVLKLAETTLGIYNSSTDTYRTFCKRCGTSLTFCHDADRGPEWTLGPLVDVAVGTLDRECLEMEGLRAERHGWWGDGVDWIKRMVWEGSKDVGGGCGLIRHPTGRLSGKVE